MGDEGPHPFPVKNGGTGAATFTPGVVLANGTSALTGTPTLPVVNGGTQNTAPGSGQVLLGNGSTYVLNPIQSTTNQILVTPSSGAYNLTLQNLVTNGTQSCFLYNLASNVSGATGAGALVTLGSTPTFALTQIVDQNGDFNGTGTGMNAGFFTAPVSGNYFLGMVAAFNDCGLGSGMTEADVVITVLLTWAWLILITSVQTK